MSCYQKKIDAQADQKSVPVDHDFGCAEQVLGDLLVVVTFVLVVCLQAVDELRCFFKSTAGFVRVLELMLGQGEDAQVLGPGERVGVIS
jgi:hypothetical protein